MYHSSLCHVAERVKGSENWHVADRPPDGKVLCTLCHSIEQRKQRTTPNAMGQQRTRMSAPTAVFKMLLDGKVSTLSQQYGPNHSVRLRASREKLSSIARVAVFNVRASSPDVVRKLIVVGGPPGVGKTRLGYEALAMAADQSGPLFNRLHDVTGSPLLVVPIYINFSNGFTVQKTHDLAAGVSTSDRLGARVAAAVLSLSLDKVRILNGGGLQGLAIDDVLDAILRGVVAERLAQPIAGVFANERKGLQVKPVVLFALHMDEYQLFSLELAAEDGWNTETAAIEVRRMLTLMKNYIINVNHWADLPARPTLLPVVSGTPYDGVHILWTKMLEPQLLLPANLDVVNAVGLFVDQLMLTAPFAGEARLIRDSMECLAAKVALLDLDLRPRFVIRLAEELLYRTPAHMGAAEALTAVDWQALAIGVSSSVSKPISSGIGLLLTQLSLFRIPIKFVFGSTETLSPSEMTVREAEAVGHLRLSSVFAGRLLWDYRTLRLPFVQLRRWGLDGLLPPRLLALPERLWTADDFEDLVAHHLCARINFFAATFGQPVPLAFVLPGALGSWAAKSVCVSLHGLRSVYREQFQWLRTKSDKAAKTMTVPAINQNLALRPPPVVVPEQAAPAKDRQDEQESFDFWEGEDDKPGGEPDVSGKDQMDFLDEDVFKAVLQQRQEPEDAIGVINLKVQQEQVEACDLSTGVFEACRNNALLDLRVSLPLAAQRRNCTTSEELNVALAWDARTARDPAVSEPAATTSSPGPHLHMYIQTKQTKAGVVATANGISTWYKEARAATTKWRTDGDQTLFVLFTNRKLGVLPESFFTEHEDLLVVSQDQLDQALSPVLAGRAVVAQL